MRLSRVLGITAALTACAPCGESSSRRPLPEGFRCLRIDPGLEDVAIQATLDALDVWAPHPVAISVEIGGSCPNTIEARDDDYFTQNPRALAFTERFMLCDKRDRTEIVIKPDTLKAEPCALRDYIAHELGHFWGLTSDDHAHEDSGSIMAAAPHACGVGTVTEHDRDLLSELY